MTDTLIFCKLCIIIVGILFPSFVFWSCGCKISDRTIISSVELFFKKINNLKN